MIIYPTEVKSYVMDSGEDMKYKKEILKLIKKKKLPKTLEVSIVKDVLKILEENPEHEYDKKYDVFFSQHPLFF